MLFDKDILIIVLIYHYHVSENITFANKTTEHTQQPTQQQWLQVVKTFNDVKKLWLRSISLANKRNTWWYIFWSSSIMNCLLIWFKRSSAHVLEGTSSVTSFINIDEQIDKSTEVTTSPMNALLAIPFSWINLKTKAVICTLYIQW